MCVCVRRWRGSRCRSRCWWRRASSRATLWTLRRVCSTAPPSSTSASLRPARPRRPLPLRERSRYRPDPPYREHLRRPLLALRPRRRPPPPTLRTHRSCPDCSRRPPHTTGPTHTRSCRSRRRCRRITPWAPGRRPAAAVRCVSDADGQEFGLN